MLDSFMNKRKDVPNKNKESLIENVRLVLKSETIFEDEAQGLSVNFITPDEISAMDDIQKQQMMLGIDLDNDEEEELKRRMKNMNDEEKEDFKMLREKVKSDNELTLDFGYYHLGNDGLEAILPTIIDEYILKIKVLNLSYNGLSDIGVSSLIQKMAAMGAIIEELNLSGNKISDETLVNLADHIRKGKLKYLTKVKVDDTLVTKEGQSAMKVANMAAERNKGNKLLKDMTNTAMQRDQAQFDGDV